MVADGMACTCPFDPMEMTMHNFVVVSGTFPFTVMFEVSDLLPHTLYCLQSVGDYGSEITRGRGRIFTTGSKSLWGV